MNYSYNKAIATYKPYKVMHVCTALQSTLFYKVQM